MGWKCNTNISGVFQNLQSGKIISQICCILKTVCSTKTSHTLGLLNTHWSGNNCVNPDTFFTRCIMSLSKYQTECMKKLYLRNHNFQNVWTACHAINIADLQKIPELIVNELIGSNVKSILLCDWNDKSLSATAERMTFSHLVLGWLSFLLIENRLLLGRCWKHSDNTNSCLKYVSNFHY